MSQAPKGQWKPLILYSELFCFTVPSTLEDCHTLEPMSYFPLSVGLAAKDKLSGNTKPYYVLDHRISIFLFQNLVNILSVDKISNTESWVSSSLRLSLL